MLSKHYKHFACHAIRWHYGWTFWFRLFGKGLHISNRPKSRAYFSERYGYTKAIYIFGLRVEILK